MTKAKNIVVFAEFSRVSALQKIRRLIDADKDKWILAFEELDEHHILRVPNEVFFNVVEVSEIIQRSNGILAHKLSLLTMCL